ncbi:cupin domain-containing protein [Nonomuraea sediminis]|uniref:cupin domain-containing protein n=1 Tax=Nonomuraea sediminis TaxID=2835864 RepID=UPI001BDBCDA6|nr:cupin domain-containing protein [Nonomuraea sediminis]
MRIRRVVTGHDPDGKAVVVSDGEVPPFAPDAGQKWSIWAADAAPTFPDDGAPPPFGGPLAPSPGGCHVTMFTLPPRFNPDDLFPTADPAEMAAAFRAYIDHDTHPMVGDPNPPGAYGTVPGASTMHATATVDVIMQLSGESVLVLEDREVRLAPGDWVVTNGVMHSWRNDGDETAVLVGVVYGAHHRGAPLRVNR